MTNIDYNELLLFDSLEESQQHVADDLQPPVIHHCYQLSRLPFRTESIRLEFQRLLWSYYFSSSSIKRQIFITMF